MLEPILQQVGQGNPQLAAIISQNPDAFLSLLSEGVEDEGESEGGPGVQTISVTPEEHDAIDRVRNQNIMWKDSFDNPLTAVPARIQPRHRHPSLRCLRPE